MTTFRAGRVALALCAVMAATGPASAGDILPGMPPVPDRTNLYSETAANKLSVAVAGHLQRIYVPEHGSDSVSVIDPATMKVVERMKAGRRPQHVVPSYDLKTLWIANNADDGSGRASLIPIDPRTGKRGAEIKVPDPYNMYFTPDGSAAIIVAEAHRKLEFRDPKDIRKVLYTIETPDCGGINHADFSLDGRYAIFSCEFVGAVTKIDLVNRKVVGTLRLSRQGHLAVGQAAPTKRVTVSTKRGRRTFKMVMSGHGGGRHHCMPQDVRISPDGKVFYVADMISDGVFLIDGETLSEIGFIETGPGAHGFAVSRDAKRLFVANRGSHAMPSGFPGGNGSVTVIDFATRAIVARWPIPGGGSPDMGGVSADGKTLWFAGRFDDEVYAIDTASGAVTKIPVGSEPHGLAVWPQPGRYSLGHTGNLR